VEHWLRSDESQRIEGTVNNPQKGGYRESDMIEKASFGMQFYLLSARAQRNAWRNKLMLRGRLAQTLFLSVVIGLIFLQLTNDQRGIQDREGSLFFIAVNGVMTSTMGVLSIFAAEKAVFIREYGSGLYGLPAYFFSRTFVELPFKIIFPIIGGSIIYWTIGFQPVATKFLIMIGIMVLLENTGTALGIFVASFFQDIAVALAVVPMFLMPLMIFSGFFVNTATSPVWLRWIKYISPMKYAFVALVENEFTGLHLHCTPGQMQNATAAGGNAVPYCATTSGEQVIRLLGFDHEQSIGLNVLILACMYVGFLFFGYLALWRQVLNRQK